MSKELALKQKSQAPSAISPEQVEILRSTLFKKFSDDEMKFSLAVCSRTGLDPFLRQVHFTKRKNKTTGEETIVITTGIDGFRLSASRTDSYAGSDDPVFELDEKGKPSKATVTVYKIVQGQRCAFTASARWVEFYPGDGNDGFMWRKLPFQMLGKCAEAQALRKAFPFELSNLYAHEELAQASNDKTVIKAKAKAIQERVVENIEEEPEEIDEALKEEPKVPGVGDYVVKIGKKIKGKKLSSLTKDEIADYAEWVESNIENKSPDTLEFLAKAAEYLEGA